MATTTTATATSFPWTAEWFLMMIYLPFGLSDAERTISSGANPIGCDLDPSRDVTSASAKEKYT